MRKPYLMLFVILMGSLISCQQKGKAESELLPELVQAEALMYPHPDSALHILQHMSIPSASKPLQQATWALLMTQAKYKNYQAQSDSLINIAYNYFIGKEDSQRKAMVLYYKGALCYEHRQIEEAQEYYLQASDEIIKTQDNQLAYLIYYELGDLYLRRSFYEYALENFKKASYHAKQSLNRKYIYSSYINLARVTGILEQTDSSVCYYKRAIELAEAEDDLAILRIASNELAGVYIHIKDFNSALAYTRKSLFIDSKHEPSKQIFLSLGEIYRNLDMVDSACYYLNKASQSSSIATVRSAYQALYYLCRDHNKYEEMVKYSDSLFVYQDSIYTLNKAQALIEMQAKYDQQKVINEKNLLKIEKDRSIQSMLIALAIVLCISIILIYSYQRKLILRERTIKRQEEDIHRNILQMQENEIAIRQNNKRLEELSSQIKESEGMQEQLEELQKAMIEIRLQNKKLKVENETLQNNISNYSSRLNEKTRELDNLKILSNENQLLRNRETFLSNLLISYIPILQKLKKTPKYIEESQWKEIKEIIDQLFNHFTFRLVQSIPSLTEGDLQICCLIKLRITNQDIATSLGISPTSVTKRKQRLKERIIEKEGTLGKNLTLELWLWEF